MKIGIFTDSHYSSAKLTCDKRYNSESLRKIREAFDYFLKENCNLVICLGDLTDCEKGHDQEIANLKKISNVIKEYSIKTFVLMGNHDAFSFEEDEFYSILGENCRPQNICLEGKNLVFIDACYFKNGKHYKPGDSDWTDTFYPEAEQLKEYLSMLSGDTFLFMHQNIDPAIHVSHRLFNSGELFDMIDRCQKVCGVYQGHYHPGAKSEYNGIQYITFPAMCENEGAYYILEQ